MTEFVASNGLRVYLDEHGGVAWGGPGDGQPWQKVTQAFREFFQAERDTELGRWRSKEHPEYVVYVADNGLARVLNEIGGIAGVLLHKRGGRVTSVSEGVAQEFFAAHPESKPWRDAKPGDIWALTGTDGVTAQYLADQGRFFKLPLLTPHEPSWQPADFASDFTAGRRLHPEVSHD